MAKNSERSSDDNRDESRVGFRIAEKFDIPADQLAECLEGAMSALQDAPEELKPANNKAVRGLTQQVEAIRQRVTDPRLWARLIEAVSWQTMEPGADQEAAYVAWCDARARVERSISALDDLVTIAKASAAYPGQSGRPGHDREEVIAALFTSLWVDDLGRQATISGHADDGRKVSPSGFLVFIHDCMHEIGLAPSMQLCRTILMNLREKTNPQLRNALWLSQVDR